MFKLRTIIVLIPFLFLLSCSSNKTVEHNDTVLSIFSTEEASDLQRIHDFFTNEICEKTGIEEANTVDCFEKFMADMKESGKTGTYTYFIQTEKIEELFANLKTDLFNEIWATHNVTNELEVNYEITDLAITGKYARFLAKVGETDQTIANYHEDLLSSGAISAGAIASMLMLPEKYNISDCKVRLIVAIHYITEYYQPNI